jgi:hypothetical protein
MIKLIGLAAAAAVALAPAVTGLVGNPSLSQQVPVKNGPQSDDSAVSHRATPKATRGREVEPGDDRGGSDSSGTSGTSGTSGPSSATSGGEPEPGDDRGGHGADDPAGHH